MADPEPGPAQHSPTADAATTSSSTPRRHWVLISLGVLTLALLGVTAWFGLSARSAYAELTAARDDLLSARSGLGATDLGAASAGLESAAGHASTAADQVDSPLWSVAAAVPVLGATPAAVQSVATALDQALTGLAPAAATLQALDPDTLVTGKGRIDLATLQDAAPAVRTAQEGVAQAQGTLAEAPSRANGDLVVAQVDAAATELATQLDELAGPLDTALTAATIVPPLLGADGPRRYFVAILNPNETRGTGGFLGQYAILRAEDGLITVDEVGSNSDLPTLPTMPEGLGEQYLARYGDDPTLVANMNLSPHHPDAATLWLESYRLKTGETLDGAFSADVVALGDLVTASGQTIPLPDGGSLTGEELTEFALQGIYEKFPQPGESPQRKAYQEAVTTAAFDVVTGAPNRTAMASALGQALTDRRIQLWTADEAAQAEILDAGLGGSLAVGEGPNVAFVAINISASKLDAFLEREVTYEVGRCPNPETGLVTSRFTVELTNAIPEGTVVPEYMISGAERGPDGPVNLTVAQFHLPLGAEVDEVFVDGKSIGVRELRRAGSRVPAPAAAPSPARGAHCRGRLRRADLRHRRLGTDAALGAGRHTHHRRRRVHHRAVRRPVARSHDMAKGAPSAEAMDAPFQA